MAFKSIESLTHSQLNHLVAQALGARWDASQGVYIWPGPRYSMAPPNYAGDWAHGGPVVQANWDAVRAALLKSDFYHEAPISRIHGDELLPAMLRSYLVSLHGQQVEIDKEFK